MQNKTIPTCFVIHSFDSGKFDRRYEETIKPALMKAEVDPLRADKILGLNPIIEKIEKAIESASICLAEVSEDNPNVWLELGYALALNKPTIILCDKGLRQKLPFDVQHRPVIFYRSDSKSGFEELEAEIIKIVKNQLNIELQLNNSLILKAGNEKNSDIETYEVSILSYVFALWPTSVGSATHWDIEKKLRNEGFTGVGVALGLTKLLSRNYIIERNFIEEDHQYGSVEIKRYQITPEGINWIHENSDLLVIKDDKRRAQNDNSSKTLNKDKDIPF